MFLLSCCRLVFFSGVLPTFLHICWVFCSRKCLAKTLFVLGLVFEIHFRERTIVFVVLSHSSVFGGVLHTFFHIRWFLFPRVLGKNSLLPRLVFETLLGRFSGMSFGQSFGGWGGGLLYPEKPLLRVPESGEELVSGYVVTRSP